MRRTVTKSWRKAASRPTEVSSGLAEDDFLAHFNDPALFSYAIGAVLLMRQIGDYRRRCTDTPKLRLVLHGRTLVDREIDGVLDAQDQLHAAKMLIAEKIDRLG